MPDHKQRGQPSAFAAIFDCDKGHLMILSEMNTPRHSHGITFVDNEVYVIGGVTPKEYATGKCERYNLISKNWQSIPASSCNRIHPKICASFNTKIIYVFGGVPDNPQQNRTVEMLHTTTMEWKPLQVQLPLEFKANRLHFPLMVEGKFYMPPLAV